jgi:AcrR family transcriptional regulator
MATAGKSAGPMMLVWERPEPMARTGGSVLTGATIAEAGMAIADREGLHNVSVRRVASKLGITAARLEAYLPSREDLLDLLLDAAFGEIDIATRDPNGTWRDDLREIAWATQAVALQHPWLRMLAGTRTPCGPNGLRNSERVLASMDGLDLDAATTTNAVNTVLAYVYGFVQLEMAHGARKGDDVDADMARRAHTAGYLVNAVNAGDFPRLAQVFADATALTTDDAFGTGLRYVLDGIANLIDNTVPGAITLADSLLAEDNDEAAKHRRGRRR